MYLVTLVIMLAAQGRGYYLMPAYPMLIAGGAYFGEQWLGRQSESRRRWVRGAAVGSLVVFGAAAVVLVLPLAPVNSAMVESDHQYEQRPGRRDRLAGDGSKSC